MNCSRQLDWMKGGGRPEQAAQLHAGLGPCSSHGTSTELGRQGRAGVDPSSNMTTLATHLVRLWWRQDTSLWSVAWRSMVIPSRMTNIRGQLISKGIGKGSSSQVGEPLEGHAKRTMFKQLMDGTLVLWHSECLLQQRTISPHCFLKTFIIILLAIFTLLRKTTIFTAFAFYPWSTAFQSTFLWAWKRHLHWWGGGTHV